MSIPYRLTVSQEQPPETTVRMWRYATKTAMSEIGKNWHKKKAKLHFTPQAARIYGYQPRSIKYQRRKEQLAKRGKVESGGKCPIVFTGLARRVMLASADVRGYPTRATVLMNSPSYIARKYKGGRPSLLSEITTVTSGEIAEYSEYFVDRVTEIVNQPKPPRRKRIG